MLIPRIVKNGPCQQQLPPTGVLAKREQTNKTPDKVCKKQLDFDTQLVDSDDEEISSTCASVCQHTIPMNIHANTLSTHSTENTSCTVNDLTANESNIDPLIFSNSKTADIRVLIIYPNLNVVVKHNLTKLAKSLLKAIASDRWKTAANIILKHDSIIAHIQDLLGRKINDEFQQLSSDCLLKGNSPKEITGFANDAFVNELSVKSPYGFLLSMVHVVC